VTSICGWSDRCRNFASCADWPRYAWSRAVCEAAVAGVADGRLRYDAEAAARCVAAMDDPTCGPVYIVLADNLGREASGPCSDVFVGLGGDGATCYRDAGFAADGCDADHACTRSSCPGTCAAWAPVGTTCDADHECEPTTSFCDQTQTCRALRGAGVSCDYDYQCQSPLRCYSTEQGGPGKCVSPLGIGDACVAPLDCFPGLVCVDGACAQESTAGGVCRDDGNCPEGLVCRPETVAAAATATVGDGRCLAPIAVGETCSELPWDWCGRDAGCYAVDGGTGDEPPVCRGPSDQGGPCDPAGCKEGLHCLFNDSGPFRCAQQLPLGGFCGQSVEPWKACAEGVCASDGTCRALGGAEGVPCAYGEPASCAEQLFCDDVSGECTAPRASGEQCSVQYPLRSCAAGLWCENGDPPTCAARLATGEVCEYSVQCLSERCEGPSGARVCVTEDAPPYVVGCFGP
ncbi:MAG: hypothetical protein KC635_17515, partial [Myxococcales bacterium]|nr:hypothetical protein [Myxococcales bacterium]